MDPVSIASGLIGAVFGAGALYARVADIGKKCEALSKRLEVHDGELRAQLKATHEVQIEAERAKARIAVLEKDSEERTFSIDKLESTVREETKGQNKILNQIQQQQVTLTRTVSQEMRSPIPRSEPGSDPPAVGPMRRRQGSINRGE